MRDWKKSEDRRKQLRKDPSTRPRWIVQDSRKWDRKKGLVNDLDIEFVASLIKDGCRYCGETELQMTLDRIDNSIGHIKLNVVSSCVRCNYLRKDMPWAAWLSLVDAIRKTREAGLFGSWVGSCHL